MNNNEIATSEGLYIVVSAPSGTGKTSILRELLRVCPDLIFAVSHTTRPARSGEIDGKDYHFISEESFREKIARGEFAEWKEHFGYLYGTSTRLMNEFLEKGLDLVLDIETRGAKVLKENYPGGVFVFILPPSFVELKKRLVGRGLESESLMDERMAKALDEIREIVWYDYIIFNDELNDAVDNLRSIYMAEKSRRERVKNRIKDFLG